MLRPREQFPIALLDDVFRIMPISHQRHGVRQRRLNRPGDPGALTLIVVVWPVIGRQCRLLLKPQHGNEFTVTAESDEFQIGGRS